MISIKNPIYLHPGAAFPAKKITLGLTFLRSSGVMALIAKYLCGQSISTTCSELNKCKTYVDNTHDVQGLTLQ